MHASDKVCVYWPITGLRLPAANPKYSPAAREGKALSSVPVLQIAPKGPITAVASGNGMKVEGREDVSILFASQVVLI